MVFKLVCSGSAGGFLVVDLRFLVFLEEEPEGCWELPQSLRTPVRFRLRDDMLLCWYVGALPVL